MFSSDALSSSSFNGQTFNGYTEPGLYLRQCYMNEVCQMLISRGHQISIIYLSKSFEALKYIFSQHGIPQILVSDKFAEEYNFKYVTSSPYYPQSNGCAEREVQTVKKLLEGTTDPYLSLLAYCTTPLPWSQWVTNLQNYSWVGYFKLIYH